MATEEEVKKLNKNYDELYAKVTELIDTIEERNRPVDPGIEKVVTVFNAEVTCDATYSGYIYFRLDNDMTAVNNIYVDVYPVPYRSTVKDI